MRPGRALGLLTGGLAAVLGLVLLAAAGTYLWLRTSLPEGGEAVVRGAGLVAPVEVLRDDNGVPHIDASTPEDAAFALGYVHAQDRLWQMETMRRLGAGRLSEVAGSRTIDTDRYMRTLGLHRLAEAQLARAEAPLKRVLESYAGGVNAWLKHHDGALPPEFITLRFSPEPWRPADSMLWGPLMAWRLGTNRHHELLRARLSGHLRSDQIAELWPPYPDDAPVTLPEGAQIGEAVDFDRIQAADPAWHGMPVGASNIWAVAGSMTASGKPLLANDPHLPFSIPGTWYLARVLTPDLELVGATAPGVPFMILGHNGRLAWGMTTANADVEDLFVEAVDPENPDRYLVPDGGSESFETRREVIRVRGGEDVVMVVRATRHGPVISDAIAAGIDAPIQAAGDSAAGRSAAGSGPVAAPEGARVLALAATYLREDDGTAGAMLALNRAQDWTSFNAALADFHVTPQNLFYADVDGNIGFVTPGRVPIRKSGRGVSPSAGWTGESDWIGFIPYEQMPRALNPPGGRLVNANNKLVPDDYPWFIGADWDDPSRAQRIIERLAAPGPYSVADMSALQMDAVSLLARQLLPKMLAGLPAGRPLPAAAEGLRSWSGEMDRERPEPLLFEAWLRELGRAVYADELGNAFEAYWSHRAEFIDHVLDSESAWCDDVASAERETCADRLQLSLDAAFAALEQELGPAATWRWGRVHQAQFHHRFFGAVPVLGRLANRSIPQDGGFFTIDRGANHLGSGTRPYASVHGAGYRAVYDLADLAQSRFIVTPGQSGNLLSPHYDDLIESWRDGGFITLGDPIAEVRRSARGRLMLSPDESPPRR